jgi:hypothetical protein
MKYHLITALLLLVAIALYLAGLSGAGVIVFLAGLGFETWFWARLVVKPRSPKAPFVSTSSRQTP